MPDIPGGQPIHALKAAVVAFLASELPHLLPDCLEVRVVSLTRGKRLVTVCVPREDTCRPPPAQPTPPEPPTAPPGPARGPVLNDMERDILQAAEESGDEMTGEQIAERAGYEPSALFRQTLAALRRRGLLSGEPGSRGYRAVTQPPPAP